MDKNVAAPADGSDASHTTIPADAASQEPSPPQTPTPKPKEPAVTFRQMFRYATPGETALNIISSIIAIGNGIIFPCFTLLFGKLLAAFNSPQTDFVGTINTYALYFFLLAIGAGLAGFVEILPTITAERQVRRVRSAYLAALLRQDIPFYDTHKGGELAARLTEDALSMVGGMGSKVTSTVHFTATFVGGIIVGFTSSWHLTLVVFAAVPLIILIMGFLARITVTFESRLAAAYARAGNSANETIANIRTVFAFNGASTEVDRYDSHLAVAAAAGEGKGWLVGAAVGGIFGTIFILYGFASIVAGVLIVQSRTDQPACRFDPTISGCFSGSNVVQTLMAVLIGAFALGQVGPNFAAFASAQTAAYKLFEIIDRVPSIDSSSEAGARPPVESLTGTIEFRGVTFAYPSRPSEIILQDFSLRLTGGTHVALVGESGSGKSTLLALVQRLYDPLSGTVLVDGIDVREWNLRCLRDRIGVVSQEPTLFAASVSQNIAYGRPTDLSSAPTHEEIVNAARDANAHDFIERLPQGYKSIVGTSVSSTQLSGGQRQRVCIARAILRNPTYLLLDEATSALDTTSERLVQAALDRLVSSSSGRALKMSLTIAHRLSTVTHADRIVVMARGRVIEDGTHTELMGIDGGVYARLRRLQDTAGPSAEHATKDAAPASAHAVAAVAAADTSSVHLDAVAITVAPEKADTSVRVDVKKVDLATSSSSLTEDGDPEVDSKDPSKDQRLERLKDALPPVPASRVWSLQRTEAGYIALGLLGALAGGGLQPIFAILWSDMINDFFSPDDDFLKSRSTVYLGWFAVIAVGQVVFTIFRIGSFVLVGERLTHRLRTMTYRSILRQEVAFFDDPINSVGRLSTRLAADAAEVKGGTGEGLSLVFQAGAAILTGIIIAFVANWQLALVVCAILPVMVFSSYLEGVTWKGLNPGAARAMEEAGHVAVEATTAIRTVTAFNLQSRLVTTFDGHLDHPVRVGMQQALVSGASQGFTQFVMFSGYALAFAVGARFITSGILTFAQLMRVFLALTMAAQGAGQAITWGPNRQKAERATRSVFHLIDRKPLIDSGSDAGVKPDGEVSLQLPGPLELRDVHFSYPSRPHNPVLRGVSLTIHPGQKVALVGPSGCGKSTVIQLLERFYDPAQGTIHLAGRPLAEYNLGWLRERMGLISQEPVLFGDSIRYNVEYGRVGSKPHWDEGVPVDAPAGFVATPEMTAGPSDVVEACRAANADEFTGRLKWGLGTHCGTKGSQLSGGQRQRIAIARAILRRPQLVLCDEATAALDSESERKVQAALDAMLQGGSNAGQKSAPQSESAQLTTSVVIAHRLSTIRDADVIYVMDQGAVVEMGTHDKLMALPDGLYRSLALAQGIYEQSSAPSS